MIERLRVLASLTLAGTGQREGGGFRVAIPHFKFQPVTHALLHYGNYSHISSPNRTDIRTGLITDFRPTYQTGKNLLPPGTPQDRLPVSNDFPDFTDIEADPIRWETH